MEYKLKDFVSTTVDIELDPKVSIFAEILDAISEDEGRTVYQCEHDKSRACSVRPPCEGCETI